MSAHTHHRICMPKEFSLLRHARPRNAKVSTGQQRDCVPLSSGRNFHITRNSLLSSRPNSHSTITSLRVTCIVSVISENLRHYALSVHS